MILKGHIKIIDEYSSTNTLAYENIDGTKSLYLFASPYAYIDDNGELVDINNNLVKCKSEKNNKKNYSYEVARNDIKSYYPSQIIESQGIFISKDVSLEFGLDSHEKKATIVKKNNFIGNNLNMCKYADAFDGTADMYVYPSYLGVNCELVYKTTPDSNQLTFWMKINGLGDYEIQKEDIGYLNIYDKSLQGKDALLKTVGVVQAPIVRNQSGDVSMNNDINVVHIRNDLYQITMNIDEKFLKEGNRIFISWELRREKQSDNTIYSAKPDLQYGYLKNAYVIGESEDYGVGRTLIRFGDLGDLHLDMGNIKKLNYYLYVLTGKNNSYEVCPMLEKWCSILGNWNSNYKFGKPQSKVLINRNIMKVNLEKLRGNGNEFSNENYGVLLKACDEGNNKSSVVLSNDNSLYPVCTELIFNN